MSQYLLIKRIKVQDANAISGFTWGFPAITHFLGFVHNLSRKLSENSHFVDISLLGCSVISHKSKVHTYISNYETRFTQIKKPAYLKSDVAKVKKGGSPSVIEEGKMNMTVSLIIECTGNIGNNKDALINWIETNCFLQRLAGGSILDIHSIELYDAKDVRKIVRGLLPGFILMDRTSYLEKHHNGLLKDNDQSELLNAWLDFCSLRQKARPNKELIDKHLRKKNKNESINNEEIEIFSVWKEHLSKAYDVENIPVSLKNYFSTLDFNDSTEKLLQEWEKYINPDESTPSKWEYLPKPERGYLVPIMIGYKALSDVYENSEVKHTRDSETDVCFVESAHSIGEWVGVHKIKTEKNLKESLWEYSYEKDLYLCKQSVVKNQNDEDSDIEDLIS